MHVTAQPDLSCKEFVQRITEYLEGAMPAEDVARVEAHLLLCEPCVIYLEQMRTTLRLTGAVQTDGLSDATRAELMHAFARRRGAA